MINARKEIQLLIDKLGPDKQALAWFDLEIMIYYCRRNKMSALEEWIKEHKEEYLNIISEVLPKEQGGI